MRVLRVIRLLRGVHSVHRVRVLTIEGRIVGVALMVCGVGMFAGLSGLVASFFLGDPGEKSSEMKEILSRLEQLQVRLEARSPAKQE